MINYSIYLSNYSIYFSTKIIFATSAIKVLAENNRMPLTKQSTETIKKIASGLLSYSSKISSAIDCYQQFGRESFFFSAAIGVSSWYISEHIIGGISELLGESVARVGLMARQALSFRSNEILKKYFNKFFPTGIYTLKN